MTRKGRMGQWRGVGDVVVPLSDAREGCRLLIDKIRSHLSNAALLENAGRLQAASLFVLLGFEESGKLLHLIQTSARAETQGATVVELKDFANHEGKASLTSDYVARVLNIFASALRSASLPDESLGGYLDHITAVRKGFMEMRSSTMFVDYSNGVWSSDRPVSREFLRMDFAALGLFASMTEDGLANAKSFRDFVEAFDTLDKELREGLRKFFHEIERMAAAGQDKAGNELDQQLRESKAEKDFGTGG